MPVSQSAVTRSGDVQSQENVFVARSGAGDVARVTQTLRVRDGARTFRATYSVENRTEQSLRLRALTGGDLNLDHSDGGTGFAQTGPPRMVGGENAYSGVRGGVEEVLQSQLPGDPNPVAVAPWGARQQGSRFLVQDAVTPAGGLVDGVQSAYSSDTALAVQWDDHLADGAGIAPGAAARYEVLWRPNIAPRLTLANSTGRRYTGATHTVGATLRDDGGNPVGGATLRWSVTGANATAGSSPLHTGADGTAQVSYTGAHAGDDTIAVFADSDGDGARGDGEPQRTVSVHWDSPLSIEQYEWGTGRVGSVQRFRATLRTSAGATVPDAEIRWTVAGVNPTATVDVVRTDEFGAASITVRARRRRGRPDGVHGQRRRRHARPRRAVAHAQRLLAGGAAAAARYEAIWRLRRPAALHLSPPSDVAETRHEHRVTATLLDDDRLPDNGVTLRWSITGQHPQQGAAASAGLGQAVIAWTGRTEGRDELTLYADRDDDGERDADEPQRTVTVDWREETAVDPPTISPIIRPDGSEVAVNLVTDGPHRFFQVIPWAVETFPKCADGSPQVNLTLSVNIDGAAGHVVDGSVSLLGADPVTLDLLQPVDSILPAECLRQTSLFVCYELEELGLPTRSRRAQSAR